VKFKKQYKEFLEKQSSNLKIENLSPDTFTGKEAWVYTKLKEFVQSQEIVLDFTPELPKNLRAKLHTAAEVIGLAHSSRGFGKNRYLSLRKLQVSSSLEIEDYFQCTSYICLKGPSVDLAAQRVQQQIPQDYCLKRERRDGKEHHITILSKIELGTLGLEKNSDRSNFEKLMDRVQKIEDNWIDEGVGKALQGENEAFFKVLTWPSANLFREELGLPHSQFHITIGFKLSDIHGIDKSKATLITQFEQLKI